MRKHQQVETHQVAVSGLIVKHFGMVDYMRRRSIFFFICFILVVPANYSFAEVNLPDLVKKIQPAVATIITFDADNEPISQGSGFFIDAQGHFITNYHVLQGAYQAGIKTYDGKIVFVKSVIAQNKSMDLVKVIVDPPETPFKWIPVTLVFPNIAENIVVIGSPLGLEQTISVGIISGVRDIPERDKILQISASISPGSSGSPVVNMEGQVVGVVTSQIEEGQNLNFAIPVQYLIDMVPLRDSKTIAEWSDEAVKSPLRKENKSSSLFVQTEPEGARIRILNIKPKFQQGIELNPGRYHVEVSAKGYQTNKQWINLDPDQEKHISVQLKEVAVGRDQTEWRKRAYALIKLADYQGLIDWCQKWTEKYPNNELAWAALGMGYYNLGRPNDAINAIRQALSINPNLATYWGFLGQIYSICKPGTTLASIQACSRYDDAINAYQQALRIDPKFKEAWRGIGESYGFLKRYDDAINAYQQALRIDPNYIEALNGLGSVYRILKRYDDSLKAFNRSLSINSNVAETWQDLGILYGVLKRYDDAINAYQQALRIDPNNDTIWWNLATLYCESNNREAALDTLKELRRLNSVFAKWLLDWIEAGKCN